MEKSKRTAFFISDGTGLTASTLGQSLLTQFDSVIFETITLPYIDSSEKVAMAIQRINQASKLDGAKALVFTTLINENLAEQIKQSDAVVMNFFQTFITPLEKSLNALSSHSIGKTHGMQNNARYKARIDAINFTLNTDDGNHPQNYAQADVILIGVSRSGKTPTCLYLALQLGTFAANYPFTEEDYPLEQLPMILQPYKNKLYGLTIDPEYLHAIRQERRPNSPYSALNQCKKEVAMVEALFRRENIPYINSTRRSIEEIATTILAS